MVRLLVLSLAMACALITQLTSVESKKGNTGEWSDIYGSHKPIKHWPNNHPSSSSASHESKSSSGPSKSNSDSTPHFSSGSSPKDSSSSGNSGSSHSKHHSKSVSNSDSSNSKHSKSVHNSGPSKSSSSHRHHKHHKHVPHCPHHLSHSHGSSGSSPVKSSSKHFSSSSSSDSHEYPVCKKPCLGAPLAFEEKAAINTALPANAVVAGHPAIVGSCPCGRKNHHNNEFHINETFYAPEVTVGVGVQGFTFDCINDFCACDGDGNCYTGSAKVNKFGVYPFCGPPACGSYLTFTCAAGAVPTDGLTKTTTAGSSVVVPCLKTTGVALAQINSIYIPVNSVSCNKCDPIRHLKCHGPYKKAQ